MTNDFKKGLVTGLSLNTDLVLGGGGGTNMVLFEGIQSSIGTFNLQDDITNYKYIYVEGSINPNPTDFRGSYADTILIDVSEIKFWDTPYGDYALSKYSIADRYYRYFIGFGFTNAKTVKITNISKELTEPVIAIARVVGINF